MANPLFHWELMVGNVEKAIEFYSTVFDWEIDRDSLPNYPLIRTGDTPGGAFIAKPTSTPAPAMNTYFYVQDIESTLARALVSGGSLIAPKTPIPGMGFWAMFADPDGIPIGLLQPE
jgi:predicted enzyme related to lactoylglutathione lyase